MGTLGIDSLVVVLLCCCVVLMCCCCGCGCGCVVVVRTWVVNGRSLSINCHWMHLIQMAERLGVRLPASPPPWASTSRWTEAEKCCKTAANYPSSPPPCRPNKARQAQLHCAYPSLLRNRSVLKRRDELYLRHLHCRKTTSLHDHRDVHNRNN